MRIGIYAEAPSSNGGVFRYTMTFLEMLRALATNDDFGILHRRRTDLPVSTLVGRNWSDEILPTGLMDWVRDLGVRVVGEEGARWLWYQTARFWPDSVVVRPAHEPRLNQRGARLYRKYGLNLVLYPVYSTSAFETRVPCVVTVHDLNHRVYREFP